MHRTGVMEVQDVRARVDVEKARVGGDEVAGGGEAVAEEGGELPAADARDSERGAEASESRKQRFRGW